MPNHDPETFDLLGAAAAALPSVDVPWGVHDLDDGANDTDPEAPADGDLHVEPTDDQWRIRQHGSEVVVTECPTQAIAIGIARDLAPATEARVVLHGADGSVSRIWRPRA